MNTSFEITKAFVTKLLGVVDAGLVSGMGKPVPGKMCVEAAVCFAMGLPHSDEPTCVAPSLRALKIKLNDSSWSSNKARANGLRRLAVAQLGSADVLDEKEFVRRIADLAIRKQVPIALRAAAKIHPDSNHRAKLLDAAARCEKEGTKVAAYAAAYAAAHAARAADAADAAADAADAAAYAAAYAARAAAHAARAADAARAAARAAAHAATYAIPGVAAYTAVRDKHLSEFAEDVVQILVEMKAPGCDWLWLTEKD
jgi:hypothetical protein